MASATAVENAVPNGEWVKTAFISRGFQLYCGNLRAVDYATAEQGRQHPADLCGNLWSRLEAVIK